MAFWVAFKYREDHVGAKVEGNFAERYWNDKKLYDKNLLKEYTKEYVESILQQLHTNREHQENFFGFYGHSLQYIFKIHLFEGDLSWEEVRKKL